MCKQLGEQRSEYHLKLMTNHFIIISQRWHLAWIHYSEFKCGWWKTIICKDFKELSGEIRQFLWSPLISFEYILLTGVKLCPAVFWLILAPVKRQYLWQVIAGLQQWIQYWSTIDNTWTLCYLLTLNLLIKLLTDIICMFCHWQSCSLH